MKKILLPLLFIATSMGSTRLSAYCTYNRSKSETITMNIFKPGRPIIPTFPNASHVLKPDPDDRKKVRGCWNWKKIDKTNRARIASWKAYTGSRKVRWGAIDNPIGEGKFPIGGAIVFRGYDENARAIFNIYYDKKPWKYQGEPWYYKKRPWKTFKR